MVLTRVNVILDRLKSKYIFMYVYIVYRTVSGVDAVYFRKMGKSSNSSALTS